MVGPPKAAPTAAARLVCDGAGLMSGAGLGRLVASSVGAGALLLSMANWELVAGTARTGCAGRIDGTCRKLSALASASLSAAAAAASARAAAVDAAATATFHSLFIYGDMLYRLMS